MKRGATARRPRTQLKRVDLRAPQAGFVHQLAVHTVGGVISNGETINRRADPTVDRCHVDTAGPVRGRTAGVFADRQLVH
jgi:hypothetical protein